MSVLEALPNGRAAISGRSVHIGGVS